MKKKVKLMVALLLCVCLTGAMVVHAESVYKTRYTDEYGLLMSKIDVEKETPLIRGTFRMDWNNDGAKLSILLSVDGDMDDEGERPTLTTLQGSASSGIDIEIATRDAEHVADAYFVYLRGRVEDGSLGQNYSLSAWWE